MHYETPVPFGQDRLILIWVATLAVKRNSREVHFGSAAEILDFFRMSKDERHYRRIVDGFKRIFAPTIFFGTEDQPDHNSVIDWARFHFFDRLKLWFSADKGQCPSQCDQRHNLIILSEAFYREIDEHRIPVERHAIATLAQAPGALDFYIWLVWKSWVLKDSAARVPLFAKHGLAQQLGSREYSKDRYFRRKINIWLRQVKALWPQCSTTVSEDGRFLVVRSCRSASAMKFMR